MIQRAATPLEIKLSLHRERREFEKAVQWDLLAFDDSKEGELLRRYQLAKDREMHRGSTPCSRCGRRPGPRPMRSGRWPVASMEAPTCAPAAVDLLIALTDETNPTPPGPELESRLQAAGPVAIPAEAGTPTIQPPEASLQEGGRIGLGDETNPDPAVDAGDETNPDPPDPTSAIDAEPPIPARQPTMSEYVAARDRRQDPSRRFPPIDIEALRELERRSMS